jgi:Dictyostelium (slime mold) repeat
MVQLTRAWPSGISLALISLSVLGCSNESNPTRSAQLERLALQSSEAGAPPDASNGADADVAPSCIPRDATCDAIDDDCDGRTDEDFPARCVFGGVAIRCENGVIVSEICNDSDTCTADSCSAGSCRHIPVTCDDNNPCTADSCSAGSCHSTPAAGVACDDNNPCTTGDACNAQGSCSGEAPVDVDDGDPCTADSCDPENGVMHTPAAGASCDDGNPCTDADVCVEDGACSGAPRADIADSDPCTADSCDTATGAVSHVVVPPGTSCSDGDACNGGETCEMLPPSTLDVDSIATFYRVDNSDDARPARIVRLSDIGLMAGQVVRLRVQGQYTAPPTSRMGVVFSSSSTLLPKQELRRVAGALQSDAPPFVTGNTYFEHQTTDFPEDFQVTTSNLDVTIPAGAQYMFLGNFDSFYADNEGSVQLIIQRTSLACTPGPAPAVDDGNACTADACDPVAGVSHSPVENGTECSAASEPGACVDGACVACSANPEACQ